MGKHSRDGRTEPAPVGAVTAPRRYQPDAPAAPVDRTPLPPLPAFRPGPPDAAAPGGALPELVAPSRADRRTHERAQRSRTRRRVGTAGFVLAVLAGVAATGLVVREATTNAPVPVRPVVRTQATLLFALGDASADGDEVALFAADPVAHTASVALVPSRVLSQVPGRGQLPLGKAVAGRDPATATATVSDLLGVTVDGAWRVAPEALASLVDAVGGVTVDVDHDVVAGGVVRLSAGPHQHLAGADAVLFAQSLEQTEDESARLARLQSVLADVLAALPADPAAVATTLAALGGGSDSTFPAARLAELVHQVATAGGASAAPIFSILPVQTLDTGGGSTSYRVDDAGLKSYVDANLAGSVPPGEKSGAVRVYVYSGTFEYGVGSTARAKLVAAGMSFAGSSNEREPGRQTSVVLVQDATSQSRAKGERVATALGLPLTSVKVAEDGQNVADVVVLIGADFAVPTS